MNQMLQDLIDAEYGGLLRHLTETDSLIITRREFDMLRSIKSMAKAASKRGDALQQLAAEKELPIILPYQESLGSYHDMSIVAMLPDLRNELHHRLSLYDMLITAPESQSIKADLEKLRGECFESWQSMDELAKSATTEKVAGYRP